jgi:ribosome biogenesis protein YTM1
VNGEGFLNTTNYVTLEFKVVSLGGGFVQTTLADYIQNAGATITEGTPITLEYVPAIHPPSYEQSFKHDEWICDVDLESFPGCEPRCLTTSYDNIVRIWDRKGKVLAESPDESGGGHHKRPNTGKWLSPTRIASGGFASDVVVFDCPSPGSKGGKIKPVFELAGHTGMINDLSTHQATNRILTASGDGRIGLFAGDLESNPDAPSKQASAAQRHITKRLKSSRNPNLPRKGPLALIPVSKTEEPIHQAIFHPHDPTAAYTVGMDHDLHTVDLTTQKIVMTPLSGWDALNCVTALTGNGSSSSSLLAVGTTADCSIKIADPRVSSAETPQKSAVMTLRGRDGHRNRVISVAGSPTVDWALVSASWDSKCMVWDLRNRSNLNIGAIEGGEAGAGESRGVGPSRKWVIPREHLRGKKTVPYDTKANVLKVRWHQEWGIVSCGQGPPEGRGGLLQINSLDSLQ